MAKDWARDFYNSKAWEDCRDLLFFKASFLFVSGALVQRNKAQGSREDSNRTLW
jgi:hypothetical protein